MNEFNTVHLVVCPIVVLKSYFKIKVGAHLLSLKTKRALGSDLLTRNRVLSFICNKYQKNDEFPQSFFQQKKAKKRRKKIKSIK